MEHIPNKLRKNCPRSASVELFESIESVESVVERQDIFISFRNGLIFVVGAGQIFHWHYDLFIGCWNIYWNLMMNYYECVLIILNGDW